MIHIFDNTFSENKLNLIVEELPLINVRDFWYDKGSISFIDEIVNFAGKYFDLSSMVGYEMHKNVISLGMHYDKDELLYDRHKILSFPLCGIVFYPKIEDLEGGELIFDNGLIVTPKTNRLVIFKKDLFHGVVQHSGTRVSIGINPWSEKPLAYRN